MYKFTLRDFCVDNAAPGILQSDVEFLEKHPGFIESDDKFVLPSKSDDVRFCDDELGIIAKYPEQLRNVVTQTTDMHAYMNAANWKYISNQTTELAARIVPTLPEYAEIQKKYGKQMNWDGRTLKLLSKRDRNNWKLCLAATLLNPDDIEYVETMAMEYWTSIVKIYAIAISYVKNPSRSLCELAVLYNPYSARWIHDLELRKQAVSTVPAVALYCEELRNYAAILNPKLLSVYEADIDTYKTVLTTYGSIRWTPIDIMKTFTREIVYNVLLKKLSGSITDQNKQICESKYTPETKTRLLASICRK